MRTPEDAIAYKAMIDLAWKEFDRVSFLGNERDIIEAGKVYEATCAAAKVAWPHTKKEFYIITETVQHRVLASTEREAREISAARYTSDSAVLSRGVELFNGTTPMWAKYK